MRINNKLKGSITVEMCIVFPIIVFVMLVLSIASVYYSDVVSVRAYLEKKIVRNLEENKDIKDIENEIYNELQSLTIIADFKNLKFYEANNEVRINVDISSKIDLLNIKFNNTIDVKIYEEDNRSYVVKNKVVFDNLQDVGERK